jgi:hypothetical protein
MLYCRYEKICTLFAWVWLISHGTIFFFHSKTAPADLSAAETIQRIGCWSWWFVYISTLAGGWRYGELVGNKISHSHMFVWGKTFFIYLFSLFIQGNKKTYFCAQGAQMNCLSLLQNCKRFIQRTYIQLLEFGLV